MAHNLATINGRIAMAYSGQTPWHKLGTRVNTMTVAAALTAANLDWTVETAPLFLADGREVPDRRAILRNGDDRPILGTVGGRYVPVQNAEAFSILDDVCREHGITIASAGALGQGERVWMLAKMPDTIEPVAGDRINGYFLVATSHDGTLAMSARLTPIRVVCQNTLTAAESGSKAMITIRHTASAAQRIDEAARLVSTMTAKLQAAGETYGQLAQRMITREAIREYLATLMPLPDKATPRQTDSIERGRAVVADLVQHGAGADLAGQTAWGLYNAVVEYVDHVWPYQTGSVNRTASRLSSIVSGPGETLKADALTLARELVAA